ncbi:MAG: DUF2231 domain-containing protein [Acidimicrobiales bacterium]
MEINTLFGLPAHPLIVHAAVVFVPLAAIMTLVALAPKLRPMFAPLALVFAVIALGSVGLAQGSGEQLERRVDETELVEAHTEMGESVLPWAVLVTVTAAGLTFAGPIGKRVPKVTPKALGAGLAVLSVVGAAGATVSVVRVGHSGAKAAWDDTAIVTPAVGDADHDDD